MSQTLSKQAILDEWTWQSVGVLLISLVGPFLLLAVPPLALLGWPVFHVVRWRQLAVGFRLLSQPVAPQEPALATGNAWGWLLVLLVLELLCLGLVLAIATSDSSDFSLDIH